jgi:hypothetical protein
MKPNKHIIFSNAENKLFARIIKLSDKEITKLYEKDLPMPVGIRLTSIREDERMLVAISTIMDYPKELILKTLDKYTAERRRKKRKK